VTTVSGPPFPDLGLVSPPPDEAWVSLLGADPRGWLLVSDEPAARWIALTALLDVPAGAPEAVAAHAAVLADPSTRALVERIPAWGAPIALPGHDSPHFAPNLLGILADMGLRGGDDPRIDATLDAMLDGRVADGRFATFATSRVTPGGAWSALACDTHAIAEVLVRFGRHEDPRLTAALDVMLAGIADTAQGEAWPCVPWEGFRGPGRKGDLCPQVTLEGLRAFAFLPAHRRPPGLDAVARTALEPWLRRDARQPYMFGHGYDFKTVKWPGLWYDILRTVETLGRYPVVREDAAGRRALAELAACLVAYNVDPDGTVTPRRCSRGFEAFSFGQKQRASPFATARVAAALRPLSSLIDDIRAVDVLALASSKGGSGTPRPPRGDAARAR
jgi:hypothetical protein